MSTEDKPHVVYRKSCPHDAHVCRSYADAHKIWKYHQQWEDPWLIATLGRVIDPAQPVIDPNE